MQDDREQLRRFIYDGSQEDFELLVQHYTPMVFSSAQRRVGVDHAQDITQAVFIILARKAKSLCRRRHGNLAGWLHTTTRYASLQFLRTERRRQEHETEASKEEDPVRDIPTPEPQGTITPLLDEALDSLSARERDAVLLRFYKDVPHADVGTMLGISENAANKRVERGLARLARFFERRGVTASAAALTAAIAGEGTTVAATGLSTSCAAAALSVSSAGLLTSVSGLVTQTMTAMLVANIKVTALSIIGCAVVVGGGIVGASNGIMPRESAPDVHVMRIEPFAIVYKGRTELPDGSYEFQLNDRNTRQTHFVKIGDRLLGYGVTEHKLNIKPVQVDGVGEPLLADISELTLRSPDGAITLVKDECVPADTWVAVLSVDTPQNIIRVVTGSRLAIDGVAYDVQAIDPSSSVVALRSCKSGTIFEIEANP